jgi:PAS domain S-box-containing protein
MDNVDIVSVEIDTEPESEVTMKNNIDELSKELSKYLNFYDYAPVGYLTLNQEGIITEANLTASTLLWIPRNEIINQPFHDFIQPDFLEVCNLTSRNLFTTRTSQFCIMKLLRKGEQSFWAQLEASVFENPITKETCAHIMISDISERKAIEAEIQQKNDEMNAYFDKSLDIMGISDLEGNLIRINGEWEKSLGFSKSEMAGLKLFDLVHPDDLEKANAALTKLTVGESVVDYDLRYRHMDGSYRWLEWRFVPSGSLVYSSARDVTEHRYREQLLQESEAKFKFVFDAENVGKSLTLPNGKLMVNQAFADMLGYSREELNTISWKSVTPVEEIEQIEKLLSQLISGQKSSLRFKKRYIHKNGSYVWADVHVTTRKSSTGEFLHFITSVVDITEQISAEDALRESETSVRRKLAAIMEPEGDLSALALSDMIDIPAVKTLLESFYILSGVPSSILDLQGNVLINIGWQDMCTHFHRVHPETARNCVLSDTVLTKGIAEGEFKAYRCANNLWDIATPLVVGGRHIGNVFMGQFLYEEEDIDSEFFRLQAQRFGFDEEEYIAAYRKIPRLDNDKLNIAMDFLTRLTSMVSKLSYSTIRIARAMAVQQKSEQEYSTLFNNMPDGLALHEIICNEEGKPIDYRFLVVNPAFERMTGLTNDKVVGKTVLEVLPETETYWIETYGKVALTGEPTNFIHYSQAINRHFEVTAYSPAPMQFVSLFTDITANLKAADEHAKLEAQLIQAQKMESIGRLAGGVAHDFNNMLSIILGHTEMAITQLDESQTIYADLQEIRNAANRSADLTKQLLAFARKQNIAPKELELNDTVGSMIKMLQRLIGEEIDLIWKPGNSKLHLQIDPTQLDQIMVNLCINARDSISGVGRIIIDTRKVVFDQTFCSRHSGTLPGDYAALSIMDNGCGMDKVTLERLFEPFFTTKDKGKGTGLGLATVYGIVKQNGGAIDVYSEPGQGSSFKIYLPCYASQTKSDIEEAVMDNTQVNHETILLVEDEPAILRMTKKMLEKMGYIVLAAATPLEAIKIAEDGINSLDLLMSDIIMPEMNGMELAKRMRALIPGLKFLFMSGYTDDIISGNSDFEGVVNFIPKPFSTVDLRSKVTEALQQP